MSTIPGQFSQIIGFKFDTVQPVIAAHLLDLLFGIFLTHDDVAMLVSGKLIEKVFFREFLTIFLFRAKVLRDGEFRHNRIGVNAIGLNFVNDFLRVLQGKRHIREDATHFFRCLQPFLLGVVHS